MCKNIYYITFFVLVLSLLSLFNIQVAEKLYARIVPETLKGRGVDMTVMSELEYDRPRELLHPQIKLAERLSQKNLYDV